MIECLCSLALSNPRIAPALSGTGGESPFLNGVAIAVDLAAFGAFDYFTREADALGTAIAQLPRAEGVETILLPGERGDTVRASREANGIPIPRATWARIVKAAEAVGVQAPV
jgi:ureidoglycolate dehydrogenase (NAD+)